MNKKVIRAIGSAVRFFWILAVFFLLVLAVDFYGAEYSMSVYFVVFALTLYTGSMIIEFIVLTVSGELGVLEFVMYSLFVDLIEVVVMGTLIYDAMLAIGFFVFGQPFASFVLDHFWELAYLNLFLVIFCFLAVLHYFKESVKSNPP